MESIKLQGHVGSDGLLKLEVPLSLSDTEVEILLVVQPIVSAKQTALLQQSITPRVTTIEELKKNPPSPLSPEEIQKNLESFKRMDAIAEEISKHWPSNVSALDALNESRGRLE